MNLSTIWLKIAIFFLLMIVVASGNRPYHDRELSKALYNIAQYVHWSGSGSINFCIKENGVNLKQLQTVIKGKKIKGRSLKAKKITGNPKGNQCHVLFSKQKFAGKGILTVSRQQGFAQQGGMIEMINAAGNRLQINQTTAKKAGLRLSSKLLRLARKVY